ncbi:MAG: glycosyltransferase family 4 protein [Cyclobacteriaceae bacterium]
MGQVILVVFAVLSACLFVFFATPIVVKSPFSKRFAAIPNHRSSHIQLIPNIGGIPIYVAITIAVLFSLVYNWDYPIIHGFVFISILFFGGLIDDFKSLPFYVKLTIQIVAAIWLVILMPYTLPAIPLIPQSMFWHPIILQIFWVIFVVTVVNAYNFIDGVDGLASGLAIMASIIFFLLYFISGLFGLALILSVLVGSLVGIIPHNLKAGYGKVFLGDSGAMLLGGAITWSIISLAHFSKFSGVFSFDLILLGVVFIPVADLFRVSIYRLIKGFSPFKADRTHIHHILLDRYEFTHKMVTAYILVVQAAILFVLVLWDTQVNQGQMYVSFAFLIGYISVFDAKVSVKK